MFLLIDKPQGITSHDVVDQVRRITSERRVGHAGTLDPNATGLLIVGIGRESTKKLGVIAKDTTKTYEAEIVLGETRDTDDSEGVTTNTNKKVKPALKQVLEVLKKFEGELEQIPPAYSAIKMKGKKAYELARAGKEVIIEPRKVTIHSLDFVSYEYPVLKIECKVSSGTYIRSLARDIGQMLCTGAYLKELRRTQIGQYSIKNAIALGALTRDNYRSYLI